MNCRCGKQLKGSLDTFGDLDNPVCQDCWLETGELRSVRVREASEFDGELKSMKVSIARKRERLEEVNDEISSLEDERWDLEEAIEKLEEQIEKREQFAQTTAVS